jgi:hypothetical protein
MQHWTPEHLELAYELLRATKPFSGWKLPDADDVAFYATTIDAAGKHGAQGEHWHDGERHHVRVNPERHHTMSAMLTTLAHEMIHMRQHELGHSNSHGGEFQRLAKLVCRHHGFDYGQF